MMSKMAVALKPKALAQMELQQVQILVVVIPVQMRTLQESVPSNSRGTGRASTAPRKNLGQVPKIRLAKTSAMTCPVQPHI